MLTRGAPGADAASLRFALQGFGRLLRFQSLPLLAQQVEVHKRPAGVEQSQYPIDNQVGTAVVVGSAQAVKSHILRC